jgi:hypothetical protein
MERHNAPANGTSGGAPSREAQDFTWAALALAVVVCLYWWTATEGTNRPNSPGGNAHLLDLQVEAFHAGHTHLLIAPDARLLAETNPYDPAVNRGTRLLDAALFDGKYYTYFGPVPLLLFMWPCFTLTGAHAPPDLSVFLFGSGAFLFQAALLLYSKRRWFESLRPAWLGLVIVAVGAGNLLQPLLRPHSTFEIPICSELLFASACVFFVALSFGRRSLWPWVMASLCYGLAVGSRPNFIPAGIALVVAFWLVDHPKGQCVPFRRFATRLAIAAIPGALCVCGFLAYNLARFGHPFEFGNRYTLVEVDWRERAPFSLRYVLANLYYYVASVPRLSASFPYFVETARLPFTTPAGYLDYVDRLEGFLPAYPFALMGIVACRGRWRARAGNGFNKLVAVLATLSVCTAVPLLLFIGSSLRYQAELAFPLFLLAGLGTLVAADRFESRGRGRWLVIVGVLLAGWTILSNFLVSAATYGIFKAANPSGFQALSSGFNGLSYPLERAFGWKPTFPRLLLQLPENRAGKLEPLWVNGRVPEADFLYVYYVTPQAIQIGFESMGRGGPVSDLIPVDYSKAHDLDIVAGPFLPPAGHPYFSRAGLGSGRPLQDLLRVVLDGHIVVDAIVDFHDGRGITTMGASEEEPAFGTKFTGRQLSVTWVQFAPSLVRDIFQPGSYGDVVLKLRWPNAGAVRDEPILSIGEKNQGELIFVRFEGAHSARIGILDRSGHSVLGTPFIPSLASDSVVTFRLPALYPGGDWEGFAPPGPVPTRNVVSVDGKVVYDSPADALLVGHTEVVAGRNTLLAGGVAEFFSGSLTSVSRNWPTR